MAYHCYHNNRVTRTAKLLVHSNDVVYQIGALQAFTSKKKLQHVKPHGAMYNRAVHDEALARAICEAVLEVDESLVLLALAGSNWVKIAETMGLRVAREIFADRALNTDGTLVPRSQPGALIHNIEQVVERSLKMVTEGKATAITGEDTKSILRRLQNFLTWRRQKR